MLAWLILLPKRVYKVILSFPATTFLSLQLFLLLKKKNKTQFRTTPARTAMLPTCKKRKGKKEKEIPRVTFQVV